MRRGEGKKGYDHKFHTKLVQQMNKQTNKNNISVTSKRIYPMSIFLCEELCSSQKSVLEDVPWFYDD